MDAIIVTKTEKEVEELYGLLTTIEFNNKSFWGNNIADYNKEWHWVYKNKTLRGSSGYNSLPNTIDVNHTLPVLSFSQYMKAITLPPPAPTFTLDTENQAREIARLKEEIAVLEKDIEDRDKQLLEVAEKAWDECATWMGWISTNGVEKKKQEYLNSLKRLNAE